MLPLHHRTPTRYSTYGATVPQRKILTREGREIKEEGLENRGRRGRHPYQAEGKAKGTVGKGAADPIPPLLR